MKIMQKVSQWFSNLSNASKIRANYHKFFSVKNQLSVINALLILIGILLSVWAIEFQCFGFGSDAIPGAFACTLLFPWLIGLRLAIAKSKEARERYIQKTVRALGRLGALFFWVAVIGAILAYVGVILSTMLQMGHFDRFVEVYPALETLSESITIRVNEMLTKLLPFVG